MVVVDWVSSGEWIDGVYWTTRDVRILHDDDDEED